MSNGASFALSHEEIQRYSRHLILPEVALAGQKKLKAASVLLIGTGGLGSPLAMYLAAAGVGRLGLVDCDVVEASNLQRQVMHSTRSVGRPKLESAKNFIAGLNPHVQVTTHETRFTAANALALARDYDIIIDGTDNFPTRYLVNDVCVLLHKPNVYGSIFRFEGQASVFWAEQGPCYRCLYPEPPPPGLVPSCAEGGVLGVLPGIIGTIQANEALKLILGIGEPLVGRLLLFDALTMRFREMKLHKDPACPVCGEAPTITALIDYEQFCGMPGAGDVHGGHNSFDISATELARRLKTEDIYLLDVREPYEFEICALPGAHLVPLAQLPERLAEIDGSRPIVAYCRSGKRSAQAVRLLHQAGYPSARNLAGGILAWSEEVDATVPKY
ncbi:MAG: molybdopterin-synthase adenylyltransferase MoeB [candidate division KSB1 bacterium]|nr:molybdopterin-synthase adenylyltransferase MoeB [candidate division KSB1 bacterium]MDZ7274837.1 molybdopterin-synthase adenylyltransferase MoeB [candidate division KSB1 bacterium]MDZ7288204.1 molybdopterin-synthase adenylyltransferase MoeB [candidate division KSB1 bacterium]MDZ7300415.1 molybdopterin-synthase adenylyltransferase MoeB [candidate division KSB1 bacterium]MDZ7308130.1 molybdopterin-synthase adenylyltransferase MoeB [candidate division KSB1 bacterium]